MHDGTDLSLPQIDSFFQRAAKVAISKNTQGNALIVNDCDQAKATSGHRQDGFADWCVGFNSGNFGALAHHVADMSEQTPPQ